MATMVTSAGSKPATYLAVAAATTRLAATTRSAPATARATPWVPALLRWIRVRSWRSCLASKVGELLISTPSTGSPSTSAETIDPGIACSSARASSTSVTRIDSRAPPARA